MKVIRIGLHARIGSVVVKVQSEFLVNLLVGNLNHTGDLGVAQSSPFLPRYKYSMR